MTESLSEKAASFIRDKIIKGDFKLGEPLSEKKICEDFNLGKTPVREGLALLKLEGLVNIIPRKGTFVFDISLNEIEDLAELRFVLEDYALRKSNQNNREGLIQSLKNNYNEMDKALKEEDLTKFYNHDTDFHQAFFEFSENPYLLKTYNLYLPKFRTLRHYLTIKGSIDRYKNANENHKMILEAIMDEASDEIISKSLRDHLVTWVNKYARDIKISL